MDSRYIRAMPSNAEHSIFFEKNGPAFLHVLKSIVQCDYSRRAYRRFDGNEDCWQLVKESPYSLGTDFSVSVSLDDRQNPCDLKARFCIGPLFGVSPVNISRGKALSLLWKPGEVSVPEFYSMNPADETLYFQNGKLEFSEGDSYLIGDDANWFRKSVEQLRGKQRELEGRLGEIAEYGSGKVCSPEYARMIALGASEPTVDFLLEEGHLNFFREVPRVDDGRAWLFRAGFYRLSPKMYSSFLENPIPVLERVGETILNEPFDMISVSRGQINNGSFSD